MRGEDVLHTGRLLPLLRLGGGEQREALLQLLHVAQRSLVRQRCRRPLGERRELRQPRAARVQVQVRQRLGQQPALLVVGAERHLQDHR